MDFEDYLQREYASAYGTLATEIEKRKKLRDLSKLK